MAQNKVQDFGQLYRAAFAETDADKKVVLLCEVRKAIDKWEQVLQAASPAHQVDSGNLRAS